MTREQRELADHVAQTVVSSMRHVLEQSAREAIDLLLLRQQQAKMAPEVGLKEASLNFVRRRLLARNFFLSGAELEEVSDKVWRDMHDMPLDEAFERALYRLQMARKEGAP